MNKIYIVLFLFTVSISMTNCKTEEDAQPVPLRDYQEQFDRDIVDIEQYLKTHAITVLDHPGFADDQDVTYTEVPEGDPTSIWADTARPLAFRLVELHGITYKIYYVPFRLGGGTSNRPAPSDVDAILTAYKGSYMFHLTENGVDLLKTYEFETVSYPQNNISLEGVIKGWREIFPEFQPGDFTVSPGNPNIYTDFGAGVMFLPSGLAYFNGPAGGSIPAYSPLIFSFKLYEVNRLDQDQDGVPSWLEDKDMDGHLNLADDTDSDGAPDYLDLDDDGDFILTKNEVHLNEDDSVIFEDCDGDTVPNYLDVDVCDCDLDGIPDPQDEDICDCDFDGIPNYLDPDICP